MATLPHKSRRCAYRNILPKKITKLKTSYIYIARDDLQRRDLFKPAQYLCTHLNQLPLLRLRTQATSYIPSHLHLANDHTYTPHDIPLLPLLPSHQNRGKSAPHPPSLPPLFSPLRVTLPSSSLPALFADMTFARYDDDCFYYCKK